MSADLHLKLEADPERLSDITDAVEELGERERWPPDFLFRMNLVLEEMTLNVMTHGRSAGASELEVVVVCEADTVTVEIVDDGPRFDPLQDAPVPDPDASLDDRPVGGLGVYLVREMVDEVSYRYEDGRNRLLIRTSKTGNV
ncbi:MAG: ATP-binding protein [Spirochaetaceae bacterium]|nr:ATP-binding protein [Spirochaetaceae bacterium]